MTFLKRWWSVLSGNLHSSANRARPATAKANIRPRLEILEDRTLLDAGFGCAFTPFVNLANNTKEPALTSELQQSKSGNPYLTSNPLVVEQLALNQINQLYHQLALDQVSNELHSALFGTLQAHQTEIPTWTSATTEAAYSKMGFGGDKIGHTTIDSKSSTPTILHPIKVEGTGDGLSEGGTFGVHSTQSVIKATSPISLAVYSKYSPVESTVPSTPEKWIELGSAEWGVGRGITEGTTSSQVPHDSKSIIHDKTSSITVHDKTGSITVHDKIGYVPYSVGSGNSGSSSGGDRPNESLNLHYSKISTSSSTTHDKTGSTSHTGYDLARQSKSG